MKLITPILHWTAYAYYLYLFGYASLFKVFQKESMMQGMNALGFNKTWTLLIGYAELLGLIGVIAGLWLHQLRNASVIWLFAFAIGALMAHMAHREYEHFYGALFGCMASVVLLATDKYFRIVL